MALPRRTREALIWTGWIAALVALVTGLVPFRETITQTHVALLLLLVVLGASATAGFAAGMTIALLAFGMLSYFFELPRNVIDLPRGVDLLELFSFFTVALVAAQLLTIARRRARLAEDRAVEIERLAIDRARLAERAEEARVLGEANRMKDALLAAVSHDLRTPLTTIRALAERRASDGDADWALVEDETNRLSHIVRELLDYSRIRGGALPVHLETHAAEDLVGAVLREVTPRLNGHSLHREIPTDGAVLAARLDFALAVRVLANLVENAAKYGTPHTPITLHVARTDGWLRFAVRNEGESIAGTEREEIFEPFVRGRAARTRIAATGVGLGLAIARSLAEIQQGTLTLAVSPSGITEFSFAVPATEWATDESEDGLARV
jgi:two-component system sensor histidine kinase KdpD